MKRILWTDDEMILALDLYFKLPFGRLNHTTPEVIDLANMIGRTNNSVALRLSNYAACDPYILNSGRHGMSSGVDRCQPYWDKYSENREKLFLDAENIRAKYKKVDIEKHLSISKEDFVGYERDAVIKQRVNQNAFREMVLANYENRCAITCINLPQLLIASHIIPWAKDEKERINPENGICLSPLYDMAFDKGLIGVRTDYTIILSKEIKEHKNEPFYEKYFASIGDKSIRLPLEHIPNKNFLEYHLENIFAKHD